MATLGPSFSFNKKSRTASKFSQIQPRTAEVAVLEYQEISPYTLKDFKNAKNEIHKIN